MARRKAGSKSKAKSKGATVQVYKQDKKLIERIRQAIKEQTGRDVSEKRIIRWILRKVLEHGASGVI